MLRLVALILTAAALLSCGRRTLNPRSTARAFTKTQVPERAVRPVYPFSVIPGGVDDRAGLERAIQRDEIVAEHYRDVATGPLELKRLGRDELAYVSFRRNGRIYWTSRQVRLAAGEVIFQNRTLACVRARCGNRISFTPQKPVLPPGEEEPSPETLMTPVPASGMPYDFALSFASPALPETLLPPAWTSTESVQGFVTTGPEWIWTESLPPGIPVIVSFPGRRTTEPFTEPAPQVPEPSSVILVMGGALICLLRGASRRTSGSLRGRPDRRS